MRVVIQRVSEASVKIDGKVKSKIGRGFVILLGIEAEDTVDDIAKLTYKINRLRVFDDGEGKMNLSITDIMGQVMVISQFTLFASTKKGSRPSYIRAAKPEFARMLYEMFIMQIEKELSTKVASGVFGADMKVSLTNDGPVTILIDSKVWE
jgi:D-tyrosyl-tRNA(Tyr) deacylase